ncbi:MAG: biotin-dependent carboxyltransferase family protein [Synergistaceae bacterium]|jgi:biotin-dependent carboxylase-like uncharacterized protein|nr:biotin-dependent carboxyltransferase family protein [Synergistaceae bacterium]
MSFTVEKPGVMTIVQDLGRWGHQSRGVTVSGPMDQFSLRTGNVLLGNDQNDAALEITLFGLEIVLNVEQCVVLAGADLNMRINGAPAPAWTVHRVPRGSRIAMGGMSGDGCRSYLCFSGGVGVPLVMGSRSTYTKASLGGCEGRALKSGDVVPLNEPRPLWRRCAGFACPPELRPTRVPSEMISAMDGPQADAFTQAGMETFYGATFTVSNDIDRMGYRLDGPEIERCKSPDIVSDGIAHGAVQVPGHGRPIVMMSDRQTTGGYTKIAVVSTWSVARLAQRMPGGEVRFRRVTEDEAVSRLAEFERNLETLDDMRASYRSRAHWRFEGEVI